MKRSGMKLLVAAAALVIAFGVWVKAQSNDTRALPDMLPSGAVLYLEAANLHALLDKWNASEEKKRWMQSPSRDVMLDSRLLQRIAEAQTSFVAVAGFPIGMNSLDELAGDRSALAFYDVSYNLSFVYLSKLPQSRMETTALWKSRSAYQSREVAGIPFYLKTESTDSGTRTITFAAHDGWVIAGTNERKVADTLTLLARQGGRPLSDEAWFKQSQAANGGGDVKVAYNLTALLKTPQFRTYWVQRNASELKAFSVGSTQLYDRPTGFEERRVLVKETAEASPSGSSLRDALAYAPADTSFYRTWAMPDEQEIHSAIQQVLLGEHVTTTGPNNDAPTIAPEAGSVGSEGDLDVLINQPPFQRAQVGSLRPVLAAIALMQPTALLHVQTTSISHDGVFVYPGSGVVLICRKPDREALNRALHQIGDRIAEGDLDPLTVDVQGNAVLFSRIPLNRGARVREIASDTTSVAVYNHAREWPHYRKLFSLVDVIAPNSQPGTALFSGNLESLGNALDRLRSASILTEDKGDRILEQVEYQFVR